MQKAGPVINYNSLRRFAWLPTQTILSTKALAPDVIKMSLIPRSKCVTMVLFLFFLSAALSIAISHPIHGTITPPFADAPCKLSIVAYSRNGLTIDVSPVTQNASFKLHRLATQDGDYILHVLGAVNEDFDPHFVQILNGRIHVDQKRQDPLTLPSQNTIHRDNSTMYLNFAPSRKTNYTREKQPWRLRHLWGYRIRFLQLAAVAFVVWFPQFIRSLPKELRDELMGETEDDLGDVTTVFQALAEYQAPDRPRSGQSASSNSSRR